MNGNLIVKSNRTKKVYKILDIEEDILLEVTYKKNRVNFFKYKNKEFSIQLNYSDVCRINDVKNQKEIAKWYRKGEYIYIKISEKSFFANITLVIAILHTYSNNHIQYHLKDNGPINFGPPPF